MKYAILVAMREYAENAKTKGFWIGIFLFPLILMISITVPEMLEKATPTRHFVLIDQSGEFEPIIDGGLENLHAVDALKAYAEYARKNLKRPEAGDGEQPSLEDMPAIDMQSRIEALEDMAPGGLAQHVNDESWEQLNEQAREFLAEDAPEFAPPRPRFQKVDVPDGIDATADLDQIAEALRPYLRGDRTIEIDGEESELFAAVLIPRDVLDVVVRPGIEALQVSERTGIQFWCTNLADNDLKDEVRDVVNKEIRRREYLDNGLDGTLINRIQKTRVPMASLNPKKEKGKEEVSLADQIRQWAPVAFVYLLWVGIFTIAQMLLNNTIEEKSNRIIEVLLSSVTANELMLGKLMGIAAIGLTMISAWIGSLVVVLSVKSGQESELAGQLFEVLQTSGLLPMFAVYFFLGYLIYSGIFLAIGSVCNTLKDAQNLMGPVMLIMIVPLMTMMFIPRDPHGMLATVMSWIPIYTPFVMMNRAAADPPMFDLIGTLVLLVVTSGLVLWLTGKIFRRGILRSGQPPKLLEMLRWLRS